jgi:chromosome segregation protein
VKLRTLRIHGFKSFADRTSIEFRDGLTAIVGSNGCGKSNVADAVRWVLGEQRASAVRGAKMDEVIFQGTARRRPLNFAEVALLFSNDEGRVPLPHSEIEIARKTFREGGSEYSMNREPCRLRDIHGLLRDTGLGANAYSIIEATMIETLLSDRAEERRALFEEAAGIGRYKDSRQSATRRLDAAEADLARLGDLLTEVESKVRSLARQKRRAERLSELKSRRLNLEVALVGHGIAATDRVLSSIAVRLTELGSAIASARARRATQEAILEARKAEAAGLTRQRAEVGAEMDRVRTRLHAREREALLAEERRSNAELRIAQLVNERTEQEDLLRSLGAQSERSMDDEAEAVRALEAARAQHQACEERNRELRDRLAIARTTAEHGAAEARRLAHEMAVAEGERAGAEALHRDAVARADALREQERTLGDELTRLGSQTDLWGAQGAALADRTESLLDQGADVREELAVRKRREAAASEALRTSDDAVSRIEAQVAAREALERDHDGFAPAVTAVLAEKSRFPGVIGPLADFIDARDDSEAAAVESFLGSLLQALVVDSLATARELRRWFRGEWAGGGALLLLPLDSPSLAGTVDRESDLQRAARWVDLLVGDVEVLTGADALERFPAGAARVGEAADIVDARGVVRLVERGDGEGILVRREKLVALRAQRDAVLSEREERERDRDAVRQQIRELEGRLSEIENDARQLDSERQRLEGEAAAHAMQRERLQLDHDALRGSLESAESTAASAAARSEMLVRRLAQLASSLAETSSSADSSRAELAELEAVWEAARDEESECRVRVARAEADLREAERRSASVRDGLDRSTARLSAIDAEAAELRSALDSLATVRARAVAELEELFAARDRHTEALALLDTRLGEVESETRSAEEQVRIARRVESEAGDEHHRLELGATEERARADRLRERVEVEWGRPWDVLQEDAEAVDGGDPESWEQEILRLGGLIQELGPVNMLAMQEHEEESRRLDFLLDQQRDLSAARDDLAAAIRQINRTAREVFLTTFTAIRENFQRTFHALFQGGECDVWLADPDDPLESPVEIHASPRGKRTQRIHLLSGGERTLTALALLFAIYLVKPAPFCILDEVDAPLDESNVGRFIHLLHEFKASTQFVVITHNTRTMEAADWVYGVTMEEPGVSMIVGVELEGAFSPEDRVA